VSVDLHAHHEALEVPAGGWPCRRCEAENVLRERPAPAGDPVEVRCDYCGAVSEFTF
jgi:hypothetical protein